MIGCPEPAAEYLAGLVGTIGQQALDDLR